MAQFIIELWCNVDLIIHLKQVDKVLRVWFGEFRGWNVGFVVDLFILIDSFGE